MYVAVGNIRKRIDVYMYESCPEKEGVQLIKKTEDSLGIEWLRMTWRF